MKKITQYTIHLFSFFLLLSCSTYREMNREEKTLVSTDTLKTHSTPPPPDKNAVALSDTSKKIIAISDPEHVKRNFLYVKWKNGIDFYAVSNEPSWSLDMDFEKSFRFHTLNGYELITPSSETHRVMDTKYWYYSTSTEKGDLIITVYPESCVDNMSGAEFPYRVLIDTHYSNVKDFNHFKGCGRFVPDFNLEGMWEVTRISDTAASRNDFTSGLPTVEFEVINQRVSGSDGCNRFNGGFTFENKKISFQQMASTMMACEKMDSSSRFIISLNEGLFTYTVTETTLVLNGANGKSVAFRRIDR